MPCPDCGAPQATSLFPCKACVEKRTASRNERLEKAKKFETEEHTKAGKVFDGNQRKLFLLILACTLAAMMLLFILANFMGPVHERGPVAAFLFSGAVCGTLLFIIGWGMIWYFSRQSGQVFKIISLIIPPLAYSTVVSRWSEMRAFFFTHISGLFIWATFTVLLSLHLGLSFIQTFYLFLDFKSGHFFESAIYTLEPEAETDSETNSFRYEDFE